MITYQIKPGQKNFRPFENPLPRFGATGFELELIIEPGGWCSLDDWQGDRDYYDWQKVKGLTSYFSPNHCRTAMFAFRFGEQEETYQIAAYTNFPGKTRTVGPVLEVQAGEKVFAQAVLNRQEAIYYYGSHRVVHDFKRAWIMREVGTYAGGADNATGPFGGRAVKPLTLNLAFSIL